MARREARRLGVLQAAIAGKLTNREGADALNLSLRQFKRLRRSVRTSGPEGVVHGNRGRASVRRLTDEVRTQVVDFLVSEVQLNDHHIADLLGAGGVPVSPASVRRIRREMKLPAKRRRRAPKHHRRRTRQARRGAMVLIDGSRFHWFDPSGPLWTMHGAIDDATGEILALTLRPNEDLHGYVSLLHDVITRHGVPLVLYGDRSGILIRNDSHWTLEEELAGRQGPTHFGRMLEDLGVRFIAATSPQAKGRIERLWATLQDRLAAELRLFGHTTLEAALTYLPTFIAAHNQRCGRPPQETLSAFRAAPRDLDRILACVYERVIARDNTVTLAGRCLQIPPGPHGRSLHKARVEIRELFDGRLLVLHPRLGLIAEQPAPAANFSLRPCAPRSGRSRSRTDAPGSPQSTERPAARPKTQAAKEGIGKLTNMRRPRPNHPWKTLRDPQPRPARRGARGGQNH